MGGRASRSNDRESKAMQQRRSDLLSQLQRDQQKADDVMREVERALRHADRTHSDAIIHPQRPPYSAVAGSNSNDSAYGDGRVAGAVIALLPLLQSLNSRLIRAERLAVKCLNEEELRQWSEHAEGAATDAERSSGSGDAGSAETLVPTALTVQTVTVTAAAPVPHPAVTAASAPCAAPSGPYSAAVPMRMIAAPAAHAAAGAYPTGRPAVSAVPQSAAAPSPSVMLHLWWDEHGIQNVPLFALQNLLQLRLRSASFGVRQHSAYSDEAADQEAAVAAPSSSSSSSWGFRSTAAAAPSLHPHVHLDLIYSGSRLQFNELRPLSALRAGHRRIGVVTATTSESVCTQLPHGLEASHLTGTHATQWQRQNDIECFVALMITKGNVTDAGTNTAMLNDLARALTNIAHSAKP